MSRAVRDTKQNQTKLNKNAMNNLVIQAPTPTPAAPSPAPAPPITCWIGLDWADQKHCLVVRTAPTAPPKTHLVEHTPEALDAWFSQLRQEHPTGRWLGLLLLALKF